MGFVEDFKKDLFQSSSMSFEEKALSLFDFQFHHNSIYRQYILHLKKTPASVKHLEHLPFLPISFFKTHNIVSRIHDYPFFFESSGTTGSVSSKHYFYDEAFYWENSKRIFEQLFGSLQEYTFFFLLPNYLERRHSSLVSMANFFWEHSDKQAGGFYLNNYQKLEEELKDTVSSQKKVLLWGVTFALLDFADFLQEPLPNVLVFETGGMKGRGKELVKEEVHAILKQKLGAHYIHSEYGMTELFSQAYSIEGRIFSQPSTMRVLIRETEDPLCIHSQIAERGGINVIDLANIDTCSFLETQDLGVLHSNGFEVLGRFDNSDIRGCNLMAL